MPDTELEKQILIVEDQKLIGKDLQVILEKYGFKISDIVSNAEDAIITALNKDIDIIIMDIKLPGKIDGIDAAKIIQKHKIIPIVYLTAFSDKESIERAQTTYFYGFVIKPFNEQEIVNAVQSALLRFNTENKTNKLIKLYEASFNNQNIAAIFLSEKTQIISYNKSANRLFLKSFGIALQVNEYFENILPQKSQALVNLFFKQLNYGPGTVNHKTFIISSSGIDYNFLIKAIHSNSNSIAGYSITIDENYEIAPKSNLLLDFFAKTPEGIGLGDEDGNIIYWNSSLEKITGYIKEEVLGKKFWEIQYLMSIDAGEKEDYYTKFRSNYEKLFETVDSISPNKNYEYQIKSRDGSIKAIRVRYMLLEMENKYFIANINQDVTDEKQMFEILFRSEVLLKQAQKQAKLGNWEINLRTGDNYWSEEVFSILGYQPFEIILDMDILKSHIHSDDLSEFNIKYQYLIENKTNNNTIEFRIIDKFQQTRHVYTYISMEYDNGRPIQFFGIIQDITDRKLTEYALRKSEEELKEALLTKDRFFNIIAHDLRNPFNHILGFADLLTKNIDSYDRDKISQFAAIIKDASENTFNLLENLLSWSRAQIGKISFTPQFHSVKEIIEEKIRVYKPMAAKKDIILTSEIENGVPEKFYADYNMLSLIFRNLITNAIKFTSKAGQIVLKVEPHESPEYIKFIVADTGIGMTKETLSNLFSLDTTISQKGTDGERGTGLGLVLCQDFVKRHGGEISVKSMKGIGSQFEFYLPVVPLEI